MKIVDLYADRICTYLKYVVRINKWMSRGREEGEEGGGKRSLSLEFYFLMTNKFTFKQKQII